MPTTPHKPILQYEDLIKIPVQDNGQELFVVQDLAPTISCQYEKHDMLAYLGEKFLLRREVITRLVRATDQLALKYPGYKLRLVYAYRHPDIQTKYFSDQKARLASHNPELSEIELVLKTHLLIASPDVAGHPTGGAIDVTLENESGPVDMGSKIADFASDKIETFADGLTSEQIINRSLLRDILLKQDFAPFDGEWWHFSYGDREWAAYYGQPHAIYDQVRFCLAQ